MLEDLNKEKLAGTGDADAISRQMKVGAAELWLDAADVDLLPSSSSPAFKSPKMYL